MEKSFSTVYSVALLFTYIKQVEICFQFADLFFVAQIINDQWSTTLLHS